MRKLMLESMSFRWLWAAAVLALLVATTVVLTTVPASAGGPYTYIVDDDGMAEVGNCNKKAEVDDTIQEGIDGAAPGDTVLVCPGLYVENVVVDKAGLFLLGITQGNNRPVVDGGNEFDGPVITIPSGTDGVTVDNFKVQNAGTPGGRCPGYAGIAVHSDGNYITNNTAPATCCGIIMSLGADGNYVEHNTSNNNQSDGIRVQINSDGNTVEYNTTSGNTDGIELQSDSNGNFIRYNNTQNNRQDGIILKTTASGNTVEFNHSHNNPIHGIHDSAANGIVEANNKLHNNGDDFCVGTCAH